MTLNTILFMDFFFLLSPFDTYVSDDVIMLHACYNRMDKSLLVKKKATLERIFKGVEMETE